MQQLSKLFSGGGMDLLISEGDGPRRKASQDLVGWRDVQMGEKKSDQTDE